MRKRLRTRAAILTLTAALVAAEAEAAAPITILAHSGLGFGQLVAPPTAGSVTITPIGLRVSAGVPLGNGSTAHPASFTVKGEPNFVYSITLPSSSALTSASGSMTIDDFKSYPSGAGNLGPSGTQDVAVGATLRVGASQSQATYSGAYEVTVAYP